MSSSTGLQSLPVELLYEVQLSALSESLPLLSHYFNNVFRNTSPFFDAQYILGRVQDQGVMISEVYTKALRYPICNQKVVEALHALLKDSEPTTMRIQLPRRLFRYLSPPSRGWTDDDYPLPLLRYLYDTPGIPSINTNSNEGYALTRAVHAKFLPLVRFLLEHHASPKCHEGLAVKVAIRQKDLNMVKTLVERSDNRHNKGKKRRKIEDRITMDSIMLKIAVLVEAKDIVEYLCKEKQVTPDIQTLKKMTC